MKDMTTIIKYRYQIHSMNIYINIKRSKRSHYCLMHVFEFFFFHVVSKYTGPLCFQSFAFSSISACMRTALRFIIKTMRNSLISNKK